MKEGNTMGTVTQRIACFFHLGRIPAALRVQLESESRILYLAEGIAETAVFRNFRGPGMWCYRRYTSFIGFFVLSERRIVAKAGGRFSQVNIDVNIAYDDSRFQTIAFVAGSKLLSLAFDASVQSPEMSGQIEVRLYLPDVGAATQILRKVGARIEKHMMRTTRRSVLLALSGSQTENAGVRQ
jgi:hypothetical protein